MYQSYDPETGRIKYTLQITPESARAAVEQFGEHLAEGDGEAQTHYVDISTAPPAVREKQPQDTRQDKTEIQADGEDFMTLSELPIPCEVTISGERYEVDDGALEWGTLRRGNYPITVEAVPFLTWESEVRAV